MGVRFAHELHQKTEGTVAQQEEPGDLSLQPIARGIPPHQDEQEHPLQAGLVELGRMTRMIGHGLEQHAPGQIGGSAHSSWLMKFPIRPNSSPAGTSGAMKSETASRDREDLRPYSHIAAITPSSPP